MSLRGKLFWRGLLVGVVLLSWAATTKIGQILIVRTFATESTLRDFDVPQKTNWRPEGVRSVASDTSINARQVSHAIAMHTDTQGSDEIGTVAAPMFELDWIAEPSMFVAEGPVFDSQNNIYFCPIFPKEEVSLVSLDAKTGKRRWVLKDNGAGMVAGAGTPIILKDPKTGKEHIYVGTYERLVALNLDGSIVYDVPTGLAPIADGTLSGNNHSFGLNYHTGLDAIMGSMGDGSVYAFDRRTGKSLLRKPYVLPGAKTPLNNINIPKRISAKANKDMALMYGGIRGVEDYDPVISTLHVLSGEFQKVTNNFSIDKNSGRIWIAASLPDEDDGKKDGWSDYGALYGLDMVRDGDFYILEIKIVFKVDGGTSSTPSLSADGKRAYVADAYDTVYALDTISGEEVWSVNVGSKVTGSIVVSTDNGEIYAGTRTEIVKIIENENDAKIAWAANLDMFKTGLFQKNMKVLGVEITANGLAFTGSVGIAKEKQKFPLKIGVGMLDRETGELIYFAEGGDDSVSSTVVAPDGSIYIGNSPLRRILARAVYGNRVSPAIPQGGITRFKPVRYDLLMRDALWAAANRLDNAALIAAQNEHAVEQDVYQVTMLIEQTRAASLNALEEGSLNAKSWRQVEALIDEVANMRLRSKSTLEIAADKMREAVSLIEND